MITHPAMDENIRGSVPLLWLLTLPWKGTSVDQCPYNPSPPLERRILRSARVADQGPATSYLQHVKNGKNILKIMTEII